MALVFQVAVNKDLICSFSIVNTGSRNETGEYRYRFQWPKELNHYEMFHDRKKPWYELIEKAIAILKENEGELLSHGRFVPTEKEILESLQRHQEYGG